MKRKVQKGGINFQMQIVATDYLFLWSKMFFALLFLYENCIINTNVAEIQIFCYEEKYLKLKCCI